MYTGRRKYKFIYCTDVASCGYSSTGRFALRVADKDRLEYGDLLETNLGPIPTQK